jgi:imidazolonepropionase-like amidohydrolase
MDGTYLLLADRIIDGAGHPPLTRSYIAIAAGRVTEIGPVEAISSRYPEYVERLVFQGCTILPGLIDTHVHLTFSAGPVPYRELQSDSDADMLLRASANARAALQAGITTIRDLGSRGRVILQLRKAIAAGITPGPRILASGRPITCPGGHLHFLGGVAQGVEEVTRLASELVDEGVDIIKVIATGGNMTSGSDPLRPQFSGEEIRAVVKVADAAGLPVTVHARGVEGMRLSVEAGVRGVEHARMEVAPGEWRFDEDLAREMARRGVTAAPTLAASFRALQCQAAGGNVGVRAGAIPIPVRQRNARMLRESGVAVVTGTDAGASLARFEEAINVELELLVGAGWAPLEAIEAATLGAARAIGREETVGSIQAGKLADFVVVRGDPATSISDVRQVERVFLEGRLVVGGGQVTTDARPHPWPLDEIAERPSLLATVAQTPR